MNYYRHEYFDFLPGALIEVDLTDQKIIYMNRMASFLFGYSPDDIETGIAAETIFETRAEYLRAKKLTESFGGDSYNNATPYSPHEAQDLYDFKLKKKDGQPFLGECQGSFVLTKSGVPKGVRIYIRDLTSPRQIESALLESEAKYKLLVEQSSDLIFLIGADGVILSANQATTRNLGLTEEAITGKKLGGIFPAETASEINEYFSQIFKNGQGKTFETALPGSNNKIWISTALNPVKNDTGKVTAVLGVSRDITDYRVASDELKRSEKKYRDLFEKSKDAILIIENRKFVDCNQAAIDMLKYENKAQFLETHPSQLSPELQPDGRSSAEKAEAMMTQAVEQGNHRFEWEHKRSNDEVFPVEVLLTSISTDPKNEIIHTIWRDITQHKLAELALRAEKEFTETALKAQLDTFFLFDPASGKAIRWNKTFSALTGYSDEEISQLKAPDAYYSPQDLELAAATSEAVLASGKGTVELELICKDGRRVPTEYNIAVLRDGQGKPQYFISIGRDITNRKRVESALEKRIIALTQPLDNTDHINFDELFNVHDIQQLQDEFAEATGVASIITRIDGTPITKPSNFCRLCSDIIRKTELGQSNCFKSDAILGAMNHDGATIQPCMSGGLWDAGTSITVDGKHIANWLIGQVRDSTQTAESMRDYAREIGADEQEAVDAFNEVPAMSKEQFTAVSQFLYTLAGQLSNSAYQNVRQARFISERKEIEAEQLRLQEQLHQSQKLEAVGTMVSGISHELNNILQSMFLHGEIILDQLSDEALLNSMQHLLKDGYRARDIVKQILTFSRKTNLEVKPQFLQNILLDVLSLERASLPANINIKHDVDMNCGTILCDTTQVHQILINLCNNAYHAMEEKGGTLHVSLSQLQKTTDTNQTDTELLELVISDTGQGMDKKTLDRMFDPFFTTKKLGEGTGLGLSVIHGIVEMMDGQIFVSSELGKGTTFSLLFPLAKNTSEVLEKSKPSQYESKFKSILLVDDEVSIRTSLQNVLSRKGFTVQVATDGSEALEIFNKNPESYDLIVTDLSMPRMSGLEFVRAIRATGSTIPIILSTGQLGVENEKELRGAGINNFIQKPWTAKQLMQKMRDLER